MARPLLGIDIRPHGPPWPALLLGVLLVAVAAPTDGTAAWWQREKEPQREARAPRRFDRHPTMSFVSGTLHRDGPAGWRLGDRILVMPRSCRVDGPDDSDRRPPLCEGRPAVVMGCIRGGTVVAWRVSVRKPDYGLPSTGGLATSGDANIVWSVGSPGTELEFAL